MYVRGVGSSNARARGSWKEASIAYMARVCAQKSVETWIQSATGRSHETERKARALEVQVHMYARVPGKRKTREGERTTGREKGRTARRAGDEHVLALEREELEDRDVGRRLCPRRLVSVPGDVRGRHRSIIRVLE